TVYLDPTFFDELEQKLGGSKAEFSQAYVIAHEVGHHVQNLLGYSKIVDQKRRTLPKAEYNKWSVRLELQADYLAGVWAYYGQKKFNFIEPGDIESAIKSANAIGDDRLQKRARGFTSPEKYTHGRSDQRVKWFRLGVETRDSNMVERLYDVPRDVLCFRKVEGPLGPRGGRRRLCCPPQGRERSRPVRDPPSPSPVVAEVPMDLKTVTALDPRKKAFSL